VRQEGPLGAAVAFPKGVQGVDLGEERGEAVEEPRMVAAAQVVRGGEATEHVGGGVDDLVGRQNDAPALTMSTVRSCPAQG
jgi:hypothetical protein